jgi:hypothetical protein
MAGTLRALDLFVQPQDPIDPSKVQMSYLHGAGAQSTPAMENAYVDNVQRCIQFVRKHTDWRLSLQGHKYVRLP